MAYLNDQQLADYGQLVNIAYGLHNQSIGIGDLGPTLEPLGWTPEGLLYASDAVGTLGNAHDPLRPGAAPVLYGFVARRTGGNGFVAAIRGTASAAEWVADAECAMVPCRLGGMAEAGFFGIYETMSLVAVGAPPRTTGGAASDLAMRVRDADGTLTVAGHSLGSALSAYFALDAVRAGVAPAGVSAVLIACPKPGDPGFAQAYSAIQGGTWRVFYQPDPVPALPLVDITDWNRKFVKVPANSREFEYTRKVADSLGCFHSLTTYLWLLDQARFPLAAGCRPIAVAAPVAAQPA